MQQNMYHDVYEICGDTTEARLFSFSEKQKIITAAVVLSPPGTQASQRAK
jgi:hypothetical protein